MLEEEKTSGGLIAFMYLMIIPCSIWKAFVLTKLWGWFLIQHFQLEPLTMVPALGICFCLSLLIVNTPSSKITNKSVIEALFLVSLMPLMMLTVGWIVQALYT